MAKWVKQYRAEARGESGIGSPLTAEQQRSWDLEIEVSQLREDNARQKKASAMACGKCADYYALSTKHPINASMTERGNYLDNVVMELYFFNLIMKRAWQMHYAKYQKAAKDISQYIVLF